MLDLGVIVQAGFANLAKKLFDRAVDAGFDAIADSTGSKIQLKFGDHLEKTYNRCTQMKTLISRDKPIDMLSQYIGLKFICDNNKIDDFDLINRISSVKTVIITGSGGTGKTIFTRYLWISYFVNPPRGRIPLYIELRRLNQFTVDDLFTYIFHTAFSDKQIKSAHDAFRSAMSDGRFIFILDGFDEIQDDQRDSIEKQILNISHLNPDNIFVVSGRPDERFRSWQVFHQYRVLPLEKRQVVDLISKIEFDKITKKKFTARVQSDLYDAHRSFMSTPLLVTMMLLTFDSFADIPEKIHVFYDQAFSTIFARHDAMKENFKRKTHTNLSIDVFQSHFASFCVLTYLKQKYEFTESEIIAELDMAKKISQIEVNSQNFYCDLRDAVCMMLLDGNRVLFTHRSFQEYFSAYFASRVSLNKARSLISTIANRESDQTFNMLFDMNKLLVEEHYFLLHLEKYIEIAKLMRKNLDLINFAVKYRLNIVLRKLHRSFVVENSVNVEFGWVFYFDDEYNKEGFSVFIRRLTECYYKDHYKNEIVNGKPLIDVWKDGREFSFADKLMKEKN